MPPSGPTAASARPASRPFRILVASCLALVPSGPIKGGTASQAGPESRAASPGTASPAGPESRAASPGRNRPPNAPDDRLIAAPAHRPTRVTLDREASCTLQDGRRILLMALPRPGDTWTTLAARYGRSGLTGEDLAAIPPSGRIRPQVPIAVPFEDLSATWQAVCVHALFPRDTIDGNDWVHRPALSPVETYGEGLWQAAEWLTGDGSNFRRVTRAGGATADPQLDPAEEIRLPLSLVRPALRAGAGDASWAANPKSDSPLVTEDSEGDIEPVEEAPPEAGAVRPPASRPGSGREAAPTEGPLDYSEDSRGRYAVYRLKAGEALYSAVVVRFTGRVDPDEVNAAAETIARASGIVDMHNIPAGFRVSIPLDLLLPEFLPPGDPRRAEIEASEAASARFRNPARARNLDGVHVILDAGHGGVDRGAIGNGVTEHEYVYDVLCRLKRLLERETGALVHTTLVDRVTGDRPQDKRTLAVDTSEEILTTPPHANSDPSRTRLGVNLRWYLANSIYRRLMAHGSRSDRVVFLSLHADSLHSSLRGGMAYIPGERYRRGTFSVAGASSSRYREVREQPRVSFSHAEALRSEGLSRELALRILDAMERRGLAVHPYTPVRDRIIRAGRAWVPAVLRANQVPVELLLEIANLNNATDARLVMDPAFREKTARAILDGLLDYYSPARPIARPLASPTSASPPATEPVPGPGRPAALQPGRSR